MRKFFNDEERMKFLKTIKHDFNSSFPGALFPVVSYKTQIEEIMKYESDHPKIEDTKASQQNPPKEKRRKKKH